MRESLLKLIGVAAALTLSAHAFAVGMGGINVTSALGQPLKADIELVSVSKAEKASLVARIASPDVYKGAGLEYPYGNKFKFQVENRANGDAYLRVSSAQPVSDPFVSLLVELTWSSGKLLREYTFLLDPPGYVPEQAKQAEVQAVAPAVQAAAPAVQAVAPEMQAAPAEVKPVEQAAAAVESKPAAQPVEEKTAEKPTQKQAEEKPVMAAPAKRAPAVPAKKELPVGSITVQRGDTLNKIAEQNRPSDVSLERMLVALYRANANQFDGKNMNRISTGKILRMPEQNELTGVSQAAAVKEIHAQVADWNAYRQKLAGAASASSQPQAAQQVSSGKITSTVADKAPVAKESAKEVLKLSKGEAPGDKTGATGKGMSAQDKKNAAQEDVIAKAKALKEEQGRAALLEKNLKDMQRLAELKAQAAALTLAASKPVSAVSPASSVAAAPQVAANSAVAAASAVKPAHVAKPKPVVAPPSLVEQILGEPLYLAGGAAALLGVGGLGFMVYRRKKSAVAEESHSIEDTGSTTGHMTTPVAPSPETGDFTGAAASDAVAEEAEEVDPISEADLFLNFGRDAQAEEILKEALQNTPSDHRIHLKLLGIYAKRQDVNSFAELAGGLQDSGDDEAWQQAAEMGRKLDPTNPMYGGSATLEDADSATMQTTALNAIPDVLDEAPVPQSAATELDFDLGAPAAETIASPEQSFMESAEQKTMVLSPEVMAAAKAETMDFDVTSTNPSLTAPTSMDFDITSTSPSMPAAAEPAALPDLDDLIFDVTSAQPSKPVEPASKPAPADDGGMEFTLDFPIGEAAEKPAAQPAEIGLSGISLNLDDIGTPAEAPASAVKDEHWHEVATKLDLAKAYQEMGDQTGAREILDEVMLEGDAEQREAAQALLNQLG